MDNPSRVHRQEVRRTAFLTARYPAVHRKLLEALQVRRNDRHLSDTIVVACDAFLATNGLLSPDEVGKSVERAPGAGSEDEAA